VTPAISGRLVRSSLRYLRERAGESAFAQVAAALPQHGFLRAPRIDEGWLPLVGWLEVLRAFEQRLGDPATLRLLRETTRATMAQALSRVWGTFLADATPESLLDRAGALWALSFDKGHLVVVERGHRRARLAVEGWSSPPPEVGAMVAEACAVFLARLGMSGPRVVEQLAGGRLEIEGTW
jgi:hypothetical protein